jgi:AraC-like DNA-binding protein
MGTNGRPLLLFGIHGLQDDLPIKERERVHPNRKFSDEVEREIVARYLAGESTLVLGKAYGSPRKTIRGILIRHHIERRVTGAFPLRSHANLYHSDPNELRRMVEGGMSIREIGRELNMSSSTVHHACARFGIPLRSQKEGAFEQRTQLPDALFLAPLTANESWLLGLLLTDGCVYQNRLVKLSVTDEDAVWFAAQVRGVRGASHPYTTSSRVRAATGKGRADVTTDV